MPESTTHRSGFVSIIGKPNAGKSTLLNAMVGRKLGEWLQRAGFSVEIRFLDRYEPPHPTRLRILDELPLTRAERSRLRQVETACERLGPTATAHLPFWLVLAVKPAMD